jgi:hypothetical protein
VCLSAPKDAGFVIKAHRFSANLEGKGQLAIQVTTDPRYAEMAERSSLTDLLGMRLPVAALEDSFQGKLWAWSDPERRPLKRRKDELDLLRLVEAWPELKAKLPEGLRAAAGE